MVRRVALSLIAAASVFASLAVAAKDVAGGRDHPLVTRFPGSTLIGYWQRDWERTTFPLGTEVGDEQMLKKSVAVEGKITRLVYLGPVGKSSLEVFRNYQEAFVRAGLKTKFSCDGNCGQLFFHWRFGPVRDATQWTTDDLHSARDPGRRWSIQDSLDGEDGRGIYGTITRDGRDIHVFVYTSVAGYRETDATATVIEIAEPKPMLTGQVTVDANALAKSLTTDGKIALYGIYFDTGKAVLKPESDAQLSEMAKLLKSQATLNVFVVGHTDSQGNFDANLTLSRQRAEAVRTALVSRFGIAATRIAAQGVASLAPVASNASEAGRTRNRRVELVQR